MRKSLCKCSTGHGGPPCCPPRCRSGSQGDCAVRLGLKKCIPNRFPGPSQLRLSKREESQLGRVGGSISSLIHWVPAGQLGQMKATASPLLGMVLDSGRVAATLQGSIAEPPRGLEAMDLCAPSHPRVSIPFALPVARGFAFVTSPQVMVMPPPQQLHFENHHCRRTHDWKVIPSQWRGKAPLVT